MISIAVAKMLLRRLKSANDNLTSAVDEAIHDGKDVESVERDISELQNEIGDTLVCFYEFLDGLQEFRDKL